MPVSRLRARNRTCDFIRAISRLLERARRIPRSNFTTDHSAGGSTSRSLSIRGLSQKRNSSCVFFSPRPRSKRDFTAAPTLVVKPLYRRNSVRTEHCLPDNRVSEIVSNLRYLVDAWRIPVGARKYVFTSLLMFVLLEFHSSDKEKCFYFHLTRMF